MSSQSPYETTLSLTLHALGWHDMHVRPVFDARAKRWLTPTTTKGWPDLSAVHPRTGVLLFAEVKGAVDLKTKDWSTKGCSPEQIDWLYRLRTNPCAATLVLRPSDDWLTVSGFLSNPATLIDGWGWLPPDERRRVWTAQAITALGR